MKSEPPKPASDARAEKAARLAQALRDNLRRRKAGKSAAPPPSSSAADKDGD